ncbi:BON domain-containing protein [Psychrobacter sp. M13]|uniref:BON domain-containing protein n=1 Tax=Psychrobacter sp. M13 TaxID=3067275 RepID=UPI00273B3D6A|nr:BON domain-containing protein [Psychrobacter sp. M13]WLP94227.1 BON domain-containing protein [Psychrobacter sp. M13]
MHTFNSLVCNRTGWLRCTMASVITLTAVISTGCTTNYLTNSTQGTYGVPVTERTIPQRLLDRSIEHTAKINAYALKQNLQETSRMSIDSFYSEVLLSGEVPTEEIKSQVEQVIRSMPDVRHVYNELSVGVARGYSSTVQDNYINSKLIAKALTNNNIKSSQVKTVTNNGVVYVMGRMTPTQQSLVIDVANDTAGVTELVLLTKLVNDNGTSIGDEDIMFERNVDNTTGAITAPVSTNTLNNTSNNVPNNVPTPVIRNTTTEPSESSPYIELYKNQQ